jgi:hypothetical protein
MPHPLKGYLRGWVCYTPVIHCFPNPILKFQTIIPQSYLTVFPNKPLIPFAHRLPITIFKEFQIGQDHRGYEHRAHKTRDFRNHPDKNQKVENIQRPKVHEDSPPNPESLRAIPISKSPGQLQLLFQTPTLEKIHSTQRNHM